jgi:hypothetical protein
MTPSLGRIAPLTITAVAAGLLVAGCGSSASTKAPAAVSPPSWPASSPVTDASRYHWIPAAARVMTVAETASPFKQGATIPQPATVTSAAQVRDIAAYINHLRALPAGTVIDCPADTGGSISLSFRGTSGGPVLAKAVLPLSGCAFTSVALPGKPETALQPGESARTVRARVSQVTGLTWVG